MMTDLEMTQLCAVAFGFEKFLPQAEWANKKYPASTVFVQLGLWGGEAYLYDPLHNDEQAMQLVKKFKLHTVGPLENNMHTWGAIYYPAGDGDTGNSVLGKGKDANRAIVECVARMQAAKSTGEAL